MKEQLIILIPDRLPPPADIEQEVFGPNVSIHTPCALHTSEIKDKLWADSDAILAWHDLQFTDEVIRKLRICKTILFCLLMS